MRRWQTSAAVRSQRGVMAKPDSLGGSDTQLKPKRRTLACVRDQITELRQQIFDVAGSDGLILSPRVDAWFTLRQMVAILTQGEPVAATASGRSYGLRNASGASDERVRWRPRCRLP